MNVYIYEEEKSGCLLKELRTSLGLQGAASTRAPQHGLAEQHELLRRPQGKVLLNAIALTPSRPPHRRGSIQQ